MNIIKNEINKRRIKENKDSLDKMLDILHFINVSELENINNKKLSKNKNSFYTFSEMLREMKHISILLNDKECLMPIVLLRNVYEDLMYFIATGIDDNLEITTETNPKDLRNVVKDHCNYFEPIFEANDFDTIYRHLSKMVHVTSIKECINYLSTKSYYQSYIITEIKSELVLIECILMMYLNKIDKYNNDLYVDVARVSSSISLGNALCTAIMFPYRSKKIESFFMDDKSRRYFERQRQEIVSEMQWMENENKQLAHSINNAIVELFEKYKAMGYETAINQYLNNKNTNEK